MGRAATFIHAAGSSRICYAVLGAMLLNAAPAGAQVIERTRNADADEKCECFRFERTTSLTAFRGSINRAQLGVRLDPGHTGDGVRIEEVLKDSPAEKAGLKEGDVLLSVDGRNIGGSQADVGALGVSSPVLRIAPLLSGFEPGDSIRIGYERDGQRRTTIVIAGDMPANVFTRTPRPLHREGGPEAMRIFRDGMRLPGDGALEPGRIRIFRDGMQPNELAPTIWRSSRLRLTALAPEMEPYFGVTTGALVLGVAEGLEPRLLPGDVILRIGDRDVKDPQQAHRILGSYADGETVRIDVMRQKKRTTVTGAMRR